MPESSKAQLLDKLKTEMENDDSLPLRKGATRLVFGVGDPETNILMIGEGPGYWEDQKGEPFVGNAGKFLDSLLQSVNLQRSSVYITNVVHHRPPENRDPEPSEIEAYAKYLDKIVEIISPTIIVTLGRFSMGKFLPYAKISQVHGKLHNVTWGNKSFAVIPMYHPAAALRNGEVMRQEKEDFLKLPGMLTKLEGERKGNEEKNKPKDEQMSLI